MRQTILYENSRQVEETRIKVCQTLAEYDPEHSESYLDEIKDRVKRLAIAKGIKLVEQSKVYVDIPAIKKEVVKRLDSPYKRYKSTNSTNLSDKSLALEKFAEALGQALPIEQLSKTLSTIEILGGKSTDEDAQFAAMYAEITNEFLRGAHGLNAYLSTRIRHGVLSNFLRKPVEDEKLVTAREEGKNSYLRNEYWQGQMSGSESLADYTALQGSLKDFSERFDAILDDVRDNLLQIRIDNSIIVPGQDSALFVYGSSTAERLFLKAQDRHGKDLEQLVDRCVEHLWAKTDENLERVQEVLGARVRQSLMGLFDQLASDVTASAPVRLVSNLTNVIARAKTDTQTRLTTVISWFKRSEVYDRQDYPPEFIVQVAHNMIRNTISSAAAWDNVRVNVVDSADLMPGRTLDGLVYAYYGLLENAIKRSRVSINNLYVDIDIANNDGCFKSKISNNIDSTKLSDSDLQKVADARVAIAGDESPRLAQVEVRSGLHKIWLAANGPFYSSPKLDFRIISTSFIVDLQFNLERSGHEMANR